MKPQQGSLKSAAGKNSLLIKDLVCLSR